MGVKQGTQNLCGNFPNLLCGRSGDNMASLPCLKYLGHRHDASQQYRAKTFPQNILNRWDMNSGEF